jgi:hypothetical protein
VTVDRPADFFDGQIRGTVKSNRNPEQRRNLADASFDLAPFRRAVEARARFQRVGDEMRIAKEREDRPRWLGYITEERGS